MLGTSIKSLVEGFNWTKERFLFGSFLFAGRNEISYAMPILNSVTYYNRKTHGLNKSVGYKRCADATDGDGDRIYDGIASGCDKVRFDRANSYEEQQTCQFASRYYIAEAPPTCPFCYIWTANKLVLMKFLYLWRFNDEYVGEQKLDVINKI